MSHLSTLTHQSTLFDWIIEVGEITRKEKGDRFR